MDRVVDDAADETRAEHQREDVHFAEDEMHCRVRAGNSQTKRKHAEQQRAHRTEYQQQQQDDGDRLDGAEGRYFVPGANRSGAGVLEGTGAGDLDGRVRRAARGEPRTSERGHHALLGRGSKRMALDLGEHQHECFCIALDDQHGVFHARAAREKRGFAQEVIHEPERIFGETQRLHEAGGCIGGAQRAFLKLPGGAGGQRLAVARRQQEGSMRQVDSETLRHVRVQLPLHAS